MSIKKEKQQRIPVYAHRGASGHYFENTMKAFQGAVDKGAEGIELDVQLSRDGVFFVIHDDDLSRVSGIQRNIIDLDAAEIQHMRVGPRFVRKVKGSPIPTLSSVISFALMNSIGLNIELKETVSSRPELLPSLLEQIEVLDNVHLSSFDYELVKKVKELMPSMEIALLLKKSMLRDRELSDYPDADAFHFHKRMMKEPFLTQWRNTDKILRVYGVDGNETFVLDPPSFVDGWITDYPSNFPEG